MRLRDLLVVLAIVAVGAGLVVVLIPRGRFETRGCSQCMMNVRNLAELLTVDDRASAYAGPEALLELVARGTIPRTADHLDVLFCPGDMQESLRFAGGPDAYRALDLSAGGHGRLTSYAARDFRDPACLVPREGMRPVVVVCDDSEDHHGGKGIVVGLSDGTVKWRSKDEDFGEGPVVVGPGSRVEELRCLRGE